MTHMDVIAPGSRVQLGQAGDHFEAVVAAVCLRQGQVLYECHWWNGRQAQEAWFSPDEIVGGAAAPALRIGFHDPGEQTSAPVPRDSVPELGYLECTQCRQRFHTMAELQMVPGCGIVCNGCRRLGDDIDALWRQGQARKAA